MLTRGCDLRQIKCTESRMAALVATAPLALIVLLMALWRWSAASAGLVGLVAAMVGAIGFFGFGTSIHGEQGIAGALIGTGAEAAFSAVDILWIILPALSLYELQRSLRRDRCHPDGIDQSGLG